MKEQKSSSIQEIPQTFFMKISGVTHLMSYSLSKSCIVDVCHGEVYFNSDKMVILKRGEMYFPIVIEGNAFPKQLAGIRKDEFVLNTDDYIVFKNSNGLNRLKANGEISVLSREESDELLLLTKR